MENPLVPVLADIERAGVRIDSNAMNEYSAELQGYITELETQIYTEAGEDVQYRFAEAIGRGVV